MPLNVPIQPGGKGQSIRIPTGIDLSGAVGVDLVITRPDGQAWTRPTVIGITDIGVGRAKLAALTYVEYKTVADDFPIHGRYEMKLVARYDASKEIHSEPVVIDL